MALGGGPIELRPLSGGPAKLWRHVVIRWMKGPEVVVWRSNEVKRWSGGAQALKWWSGRNPASGGGSVKERA
ncbi:hypothetical protein MA16_Dca017333 [Dendrobium catenatum]|uniref:Uncharacterized protein n=1 Tax=Dendrobium catenatum TaxID=906689 RepID=A0A2I0WC51_9ASPA|nr:hypothetical protein MA16_Dca017333 [Dendrobium catenatum]